MNPPPAHPQTDANASHSMIALIAWCGLNAAGMSLAKIGFRPSASSEPISATSAVLIAQILGAVFLFPDLLKTWWHTARVLALSAAAFALAVRQDQANWSALPTVWFVASAWTLAFAAQVRLPKPIQLAVPTGACLLLLGAPALQYLQLESSDGVSAALSAANAGNPLKTAPQQNFHFPPPSTLFIFPLIFGGFALITQAVRSRRPTLAPSYPQK